MLYKRKFFSKPNNIFTPITLRATLPSLSSPIVCSGLKNAWMQKENSLCLLWKQIQILQYFGKVQFGSYVSKLIRLLMKLKLIVSSTSTSFWRWALSSPYILYNIVIGFIHGHGHIEAKFGGGIYPHIWSTVGDNIVYIHVLTAPPTFAQELKLKKSLPVVKNNLLTTHCT